MLNLLLESGRDDLSTGVETDGQTPGIASWGFSLTSLKLSTVGVVVGS